MSSRFYTPLDEEANDPRYNQGLPFEDEAAAFEGPQGGQPSANPSPFEEPPSVRESKASNLVDQDPFDDPELGKRIKGIDEQLASRPRSLGGMIAAFSPSGDKTMASLMAQRHMYGQEQHGNQQIRRQMAGQRAAQERAFAHDEAIRANAERTALARENAAGTRVGGQVAVQGLRNQGAMGVQGLRNEGSVATQGVRNQGATGVQGLRNSGAAEVQGMKAPAKPVADPLVQMQARQLDAAIKAYDKALTADATGEKPITGSTASDKFSNDNKRAILQQKRDELAAQLADLYKRTPGLKQPSAAPSTAPSVKQTANDDLGAAPDGASGTGTVTLDDGSKVRVKIVNGRYIRA